MSCRLHRRKRIKDPPTSSIIKGSTLSSSLSLLTSASADPLKFFGTLEAASDSFKGQKLFVLCKASEDKLAT